MTNHDRKSLVKRLDKLFGLYIRLRDSENEYGHCITCNKWVHFKEGNASHFISRRFMATRWDERNVHMSCVHCNLYLGGNMIEYYPAMLKRYGNKVIKELKKLSKTTKKFTVQELEELIVLYKNKIKAVEKERAGGK